LLLLGLVDTSLLLFGVRLVSGLETSLLFGDEDCLLLEKKGGAFLLLGREDCLFFGKAVSSILEDSSYCQTSPVLQLQICFCEKGLFVLVGGGG